jgi:hypothetical protein
LSSFSANAESQLTEALEELLAQNPTASFLTCVTIPVAF